MGAMMPYLGSMGVHILSLPGTPCRVSPPGPHTRHGCDGRGRYEVDTGTGLLIAHQRMLVNGFSLSRDGERVAQMTQTSLSRYNFAVDIADSESVPFVLAVMLAIESVFVRRRNWPPM
jgi:hypothetical protein